MRSFKDPVTLYASYTQRNHDYIIMSFTAHPFLIIYFIPDTISADSRHFLFEQNTHDVLVNWSSARAQHYDACKFRPARQLNRTSPRAGILFPPCATPHPPPAASDGFRPKDVFTTLWIKLTASITSEEILVSQNEWNKFLQEGNEMNGNLPPLTRRPSSNAKTRIHPEDGERNVHRNIRKHDAVKLRNSK